MLTFLSFIVPILAWNVPLVSPVFLTRSLIFLILLYFSTVLLLVHKEDLLISLLFSWTPHSGGFIFPFLSCFSLLFFSQLFVKPPQTITLPSCISFSLGWFWLLPPVHCYELLSLVLQALHLPDLIPESIHLFHCIIIRNLIQVTPEWPSSFPYFLQFKPEFCSKELMIWATVNSRS